MNETYGHRAHLASIWQGVGKMLARCWQGHELAKCLRSACHHYGKSMGRVWLRQLKVESLKLKVSLYSSRDKMSIERVGGIQGEFTQNSRGIQAEFKENSGRILVDGSEMVRRWLEDGPSTSSGTSKMERLTGAQYDGFELPVRRERTASTSGANCQYVGLVLRSFRYVACLLLMMIFGIGELWGQTDYSGVYYIANANNNSGDGYIAPVYNEGTPETNFYLVPARNPQQTPSNIDAYYSPDHNNTNTPGDPEKPFLATHYITKPDINAVWIITKSKTTGYYNIIHAETGKYVIHEIPKPNNQNRRKAMHLQTPDNGDYSISTNDYYNFAISSPSTNQYLIAVKNPPPSYTAHIYWNPAGQNSNNYFGTGNTYYHNGLVGLYNQTGNNSVWYFEDTKLTAPTITVDAVNGTFTITPSNLPPNCSIRYTTGDGTQDAPAPSTEDPSGYTGTLYTGAVEITDFTNVKAVIVGYGMVLSNVANQMVKCATPSISYANNTVTIETSTPDATIYYTSTTNGMEPDDPTTSAYTETGSTPLVINDVTVTTKYKAIAAKEGLVNSSVASQTVVVNPTIVLSSYSFVYTGSDIKPTVTINGGAIPSSEYEVTYSNNKNVGTATATITNKPGGDYYVVGGSVNFDITKASLTVTAANQSVTYGSAAPTYTVNYSGFVTGEDATNLTTAPTATCTTYTTSSDVGSTHYIVPSGGEATNYSFSYVNGTLTVNQREVGLDWQNTSLTYNGTSQAPTANPTNLVNNDAIIVTVTGAQTNAGDYTATATALTGTNAGNYSLPDPATYAFTIAQKSVTVTSGITASDKVYDGNNSATLDCTGAVFTGKIENDDLTLVSATGAFADKNVGTDKEVTITGLTFGGAAAGNYMLAETGNQSSITASITAATVTVSDIEAEDKEYDGTTDATLVYTGVSLTGKVNGDNLTVTATGTFENKNVGNGKTVNISGLTLEGSDASNYTLATTGQQTTATADITTKELTITADSDEKVYDGTELTKNSYTNTDLATGDAITGVTVAGSQTNAGSSNNVPSGGAITDANSVDVTGNYSITYENGTLTVNRKGVTITANDASKTYNSTALTETGFTASALETGDTHTFTVAMTAESTITNAGTQPNVIATVDGVSVTTGTETTVGNYLVTTADGTLTINRKAVTITADDATDTYNGSALTKNTFTTTPLEDGDTHEFTVVMTDESTITYVGTQPNVIATVDGTAVTTGVETEVGNYLVTTVDGTLTINGITLDITVSIDNWTYGNNAKNPSVTGNTGGGAVTYSYKGQNENDSKYKADKPSNAGNYTVRAEIAATTTTAAATATTNFTINKAPLSIKADAKEKEYLEDDPQLTYTVTGLKNKEEGGDVITCVLQRAQGENTGNYAITLKSNNVKSNNYSFDSSANFTGATFTIKPKSLGDGENPAPGIGIYVKDNGDDTWTVSVYNGKTALTEGTDYITTPTGPDDDGNYTFTITAQGTNCSGAAQATYSPSSSTNNIFYEINGIDEKFTPYISTTSDLMASADLVPYIVSQINTSIGTISIVPISYIPKDEPVLLLGPSDVTGITTSKRNPNTPAISESLINNNKLMIAPDEPSDPNNPESVHGVHVENTEAYMFYKGEFVMTTEGTIKPGNFFIYNPNYKEQGSSGGGSGAPKRYLQILVGETTGILQLTNDEKTGNDSWYTIDGRKLNGKPQERGLYINGGKKIMVK